MNLKKPYITIENIYNYKIMSYIPSYTYILLILLSFGKYTFAKLETCDGLNENVSIDSYIWMLDSQLVSWLGGI